MAQYATLKAAIDAVIKANGQREITGSILNDTLTAMVNSLGAGYQFIGVATPSTNPGTPDQNVFYLAFEAGTYTNFNATVLSAGISILMWNGSWSVITVFGVDDEPTAGSNNLVKSGGILSGLQTADILLHGIVDNMNIGFIHPNSGAFVRQNKGFVFRVNSGDTLKVKATASKKTYFALLKDNVYKDFSLQYCTDYPAIIILNANASSEEITIPSDCKYVWFEAIDGSSTYGGQQSIIINGIDVMKTICEYVKTLLGEDAQNKAQIANIAVLQEMLFGRSIFFENQSAYIKTNISVGSVVNTTPVWSGTTKSTIIELKDGDLIYLNGTGGNAGRLWAFTDSEYQLLSVAENGAIAEELNLSIPTGAKYLILNVIKSTAGYCYIKRSSSKAVGIENQIGLLEKETNGFGNATFIPVENVGRISIGDVGDVVDIEHPNTGATSFRYAIVDCVEGDKFSISAYGGATNYWSWTTLNSSNEVVRISSPDNVFNETVTINSGEVKLIIHNRTLYKCACYKGESNDAIFNQRLKALEHPSIDNWNLNSMTYGVDNECYTFWAFPGLIHTSKYRNKLIWSWCDNMGYTGVGEYDLDSNVLKRRLLKKSDIDDHNMASVVELADGRIVFGYAGGHGYDTKEHFRITDGYEYVDNIGNEVAIDLNLGATTYNQTIKIGDTYYIFCRVDRIGWAYFTTTDFVTFSAPVHFLISPTDETHPDGYQYYCKVAKVTDESSMIRIAMYANASESQYTEIRMCYIDTTNHQILNSDGVTIVDTDTPASPIVITNFGIVVPTGGDNYRIRLFDLLESPKSDAVIAYARMPQGDVANGNYYVYHSNTNTEYLVDNCGVQWISSYAPGGICFINANKVILSRGQSNYIWDISIYEFSNGEWALSKSVYSENKSNIRNIRPLVSNDKKYVMWQRGYYYSYKPQSGHPIPFSMNLKMYDIDNDKILF